MKKWVNCSGATRPTVIIVGAFCIIVLGALAVWSMPLGKITYSSALSVASSTVSAISATATSTELSTFAVTHISTPSAVKAIYMTSWAAGSPRFRKELFSLLDTTEVNAVVIDVKDYTGRISYEVDDPSLAAFGSVEKRIPNIKQFIGELHAKGAYVIGRISSFQDSYLITTHPEWAVKTKEGAVWKDYKGVKWLDAAATPVWDYLTLIGKDAYAQGFDELNFDYIRYPSDGDLKDIVYSWGKGRPRMDVMTSFFQHLHDTFAPLGIPISADLFGLVASASNDLGIGQVLESALPYFNYIAPMVYPSHFSAGFIGYAKPAQDPYEVVKYSMDSAIAKAEATTTWFHITGEQPISTSTSPRYAKDPVPSSKIRPWLQAFDLGAIYTPAMIKTQMQATYDAGLTSWMLWDAGSMYDPQALTGNGTEEKSSSITVSAQ